MSGPMSRIKRQLPDAEAMEIPANAKRVILSVTGDDGRPYGIWLDPRCRKEDGLQKETPFHQTARRNALSHTHS